MNRFLATTAVVALMSFGAMQTAEAGHGGCGPMYYSGGGYYGPAYQAAAPTQPSVATQAPRDGQTFRSFSYAPEPATADGIPAAPVYRTYPSYAPRYGMMGPARGMAGPSYYSAGSKMQGRFGR